MSRVFSISLNDLTFAKLGELQKRYPDMSRNAMINHIINVVHSLDDPLRVDANIKRLKLLNAFLDEGTDDYTVGPNQERFDYWMKRKGEGLI